MKKFILAVAMSAILATLMIGCAGNQSTTTTTTAATTVPSTTIAESTVLKAAKYEHSKFTVVVPAGWNTKEIDGGIRLYKRYPSMSGEFFEIYFYGSNLGADYAKQQIEALAKKNEGSEASEVDFLGKRFWTSAYKETGVPQVSYFCIDKGVMIAVKYGGPLYESNPVFKEISDSVVFK